MRHEFVKVNNWNEWYRGYYVSSEETQLLKEINYLRVAATKQSGVKTNFFFLQTDLHIEEQYYQELKKFTELEDGEYILSIEPSSIDSGTPSDSEVQFVGEINRNERPYDGVRESLQDKCQKYLKFMGNIVQECIKLFASKN